MACALLSEAYFPRFFLNRKYLLSPLFVMDTNYFVFETNPFHPVLKFVNFKRNLSRLFFAPKLAGKKRLIIRLGENLNKLNSQIVATIKTLNDK